MMEVRTEQAEERAGGNAQIPKQRSLTCAVLGRTLAVSTAPPFSAALSASSTAGGTQAKGSPAPPLPSPLLLPPLSPPIGLLLLPEAEFAPGPPPDTALIGTAARSAALALSSSSRPAARCGLVGYEALPCALPLQQLGSNEHRSEYCCACCCMNACGAPAASVAAAAACMGATCSAGTRSSSPAASRCRSAPPHVRCELSHALRF